MIPHCQVIPLPDYQTSFRIGGQERLRWHFGSHYPRPFFFPLVGSSSDWLTRMGHPGAPDHDHHRSIWFAHAKVLGINFWEDTTAARIRQKRWLSYQDGDEEAAMAVVIGWYDGHDPKELLEQELIAAIRPRTEGETLLELQSTFRPAAESLEFGKTNFGFLAVRMAKNLSGDFGGTIKNSEGMIGEPVIFAKPARWMDYSGPGTKGAEGITYFDHRGNPGHPVCWHVREDGWMGASVCLNGPIVTSKKEPLVLRYLLHAHGGPLNVEKAEALAKDFNNRAQLKVVKSTKKHLQFEIMREKAG
jgi:hypothetical protein